MNPNIIKAVVAMEQFFTYNITPEEFQTLICRVVATNDRDKAILESLNMTLGKAM